MGHLEERLRDLPLDPPGDLGERARQAAADPPPRRGGAAWLQTAGAIVVVALLLVMALTVTGHNDPRVFANISAGLGT